MKKIFGFALAALVFGFASCTKDNVLETGNGDSSLSAVSFTFNKPQGAFVQTYADIATAKEWNIATLDVYAAVDGTVTKLTENTHYTKVDGTKSYTITMASAWITPLTGKTANFYFVGNDAPSIEGAQSGLSATAEATFKNALTDEITLTGGKVNLITANGTTKNLLFSAVAENVKLVGKVQQTATLKRREARFDIVNPIKTQFVVNKIYVSNASRKGLIFANADVASPVITKGSHVDITGPIAADYDAENLAPSVFYLYPTKLGYGTTVLPTDTRIIIEATANGNTSLYEVQSDIEILANTRYKIVLDATSLVFTLVVADYDEGEEFPTEEYTGAGLLSLAPGAGTGVVTNTSYQIVAGEDATITATLGANSGQGFDVTVSGVAGIVNAAAIKTSEVMGAITYAGAHYPATYEIATTYATAVSGTEVFITFTDKANPKNRATVLLYDGTLTRVAQPASNSYMVQPNSAVISIPLSRVYEHWTALATTANFDVKFLWTDNENGMDADGAVADAYVQGKGNTAVLFVKPGAAEGNGVVAVTVGGEIKWSWHIWNTAYDPSVHTANSLGDTWMNRSLGSLSATPGDAKTVGLFYQWGRKDPFPGMTESERFTLESLKYVSDEVCYNGAGMPISTTLKTMTTANDIDMAVNNPTTFYFGNSAIQTYRDWIYVNNDDLWKDDDKTLYDPCPEGWKVAKSSQYPTVLSQWGGSTADYSTLNYGRTHAEIGYIPLSGFRVDGYSTTLPGIFYRQWERAMSWTSTESPSVGDDRAQIFSGNPTITATAAYNKSAGVPTRCVKE